MRRFSMLAAAALFALTVSSGLHAQTTPASAAAAATVAETSKGKVTYYGTKFAGRKTASGELFDPDALTMAHNSLPMGTHVKVTNLANQRSVVVRVNDRGPSTPGRVGDLSLAAAHKLRGVRAGVINAKLEVLALAQPGE